MQDQGCQGHVQISGAQTNTKDRYIQQGHQGHLQTLRAPTDTMGTMDIMNTMINIVPMATHRHPIMGAVDTMGPRTMWDITGTMDTHGHHVCTMDTQHP